MKMEANSTCNPLPIIRLTALLPPPPTPTTLILADSMGANEQHTPKRRRFQRLPRVFLEERHFPGAAEESALWENPVEMEEEEDEMNSLGFVSWRVAIEKTGLQISDAPLFS